MTAPRDYRSTHTEIAGNILTYIERHPDSFEALLYRADSSDLEATGSGDDVVGSMESMERNLAYGDPETCRLVKIPGQPGVIGMMGDGTGGAPAVDPAVFLCSLPAVEKQSILQYFETWGEDGEQVEVLMYVQDLGQFGTAPGIWQKLYCIPMQNSDDLLPVTPE